MRRFAAPIAAILLAATPVKAEVQAVGPSPEDARFAALTDAALEALLRRSPVFATQLGDHRFDAALPDASPAGRAGDRKLAADTLAALARVDPTRLGRENQVDAILFADQLRYTLFSLDRLQDWAWDPLTYAGTAGTALFTLSSREFAPLPVRLRAATGRLEALPRYFEQTRAALQPARVPRIHAETAAKQNVGLNGLIDGIVASSERAAPGEALPEIEQRRLERAAHFAKLAVAEHQRWLETILVPQSRGNERIGAALYDEKLRLALNSPLTRAEIRTRALAKVTELRARMYETSRRVLAEREDAPPLPNNPTAAEQQRAIEAAFSIVSRDTLAPDRIIPTAQASLAQATAFAKSHDLVGFPTAQFDVIEMPEFARGVAVAYADMPGALEKDQRGYYAVMPIPPEWTQAQKASFLAEYNRWAVDELTLHEGVPGHLLQLAHANRFPSRLRAVFQSNPMIEGWAMYGEDVVADAGYDSRDPRYTLAHLKFELRATVNAIVDQDFHTGGLTRDAAMTMLTKTAFQEEREAAGKWTRMQLSSAQLPVYFVGYSEWLDLAAAARARPGYSARAFHDAALAHGSPPVRFIRELLQDEPIR